MPNQLFFALIASIFLTGCVAVTVVDTAVGAAATAVETTVDVTTGVVGGAVDLVTEDDDDKD